MRCGKCSRSHQTVAEVRQCYANDHRSVATLPPREQFVGGNKQTPAPRRERKPLEDGVYQVGETIYRVLHTLDRKGQYAKVLEWDSDTEKPVWKYSRGAMKHLSEDNRMSAEQASRFGETYGICCNCFRELSREESKRRGYGPTCALNMGWPYDQNAD